MLFIKRYSSKLILILTLVFLFNFSFGYRRAEASTLVAGGIGLAVVLLVGAGVAITSPEMAKDLGSRLWEDMKEVIELPSKIGDFFKVQITGAMLEFVAKWLNDGNVPTESTETTITTDRINFPLTKEYNFVNAPYFLDVLNVKFNTPVDLTRITVKQLETDKTYNSKDYMLENLKIVLESYSSTVRSSLYMNGQRRDILYSTPWIKGSYTVNDILLNEKSINEYDFSINTTITIPYTPDVSSGASEEKLTTSLPVGSTVTYPSDLTTNFPATADKPISNVTDIPNVNVDAKTETGAIEGTLDSILDMLKTIVNFITNIFVPADTENLKLDFSPLFFPLATKFPFCVPFDLINAIKMMEANREAPKFEITLDKGFVGKGSFTLDFKDFDLIATILRWWIYVMFIFAIVILTRKII